MPSTGRRPIVDAHLDIAWNALTQRHGFVGAIGNGYIVNKSSLARAGVGLIIATLFCGPAIARRRLESELVYRNADEARLIAMAELGYYRGVGLRLVKTGNELDAYMTGWRPGQIAAVLSMEGADPLRSPADLAWWVREGLRIVGPAWGRTRFGGGIASPGGSTAGLSELGYELLAAMRRNRVILDLSHMSDRAVAQALEVWPGHVIASHSNARTLVAGERQLTDDVIRVISQRRGMVGISFYRGHLTARRRASVDDVVAQLRYMSRVMGDSQCLGIGSDIDGAFRVDDAAVRTLTELDDLKRRLRKQFGKGDVDGIMGENWRRFLVRALPK